jgi:hypothetical protein
MYVECGNKDNEFTLWNCNQDIHKFNDYAFLCVQGCEYKNDIEGGNITSVVNNILQKIQTTIQSQGINEIGIIFHPHYAADKNSQDEVLCHWGEFVEAFKGKKGTKINNIQISFIEEYSSAMAGNVYYEKIEELCRSCRTQEKNSEKLVEELWEYFSKEKKNKEYIKKFSLLKHRIAHLFLPLDIDLQGIGEVEGEKKIEYLKEVLNEKKNNQYYYRQKLADLWYSVTGKDFDGKVNDCEIPKAQDDGKKLVNGNKAIIDLIKESGKQDKVKDLWEILLNLCGIKYDSDSFDNTKYSVINSPIFGFMCLMDKKIGKNTIEKGDVEEILNYFSKLNGNKGWGIKGANPIKSFHDWFCALDNCLDKIREKLKDEQGK